MKTINKYLVANKVREHFFGFVGPRFSEENHGYINLLIELIVTAILDADLRYLNSKGAKKNCDLLGLDHNYVLKISKRAIAVL